MIITTKESNFRWQWLLHFADIAAYPWPLHFLPAYAIELQMRTHKSCQQGSESGLLAVGQTHPPFGSPSAI